MTFPGDETSFASLWRQNAREVMRVCRRRTSSAELAEEAFGRIAVVAFRNYPAAADRLRDHRRWLLAVARNTCIDLHRETTRDPLSSSDLLDERLADGGRDPESETLARERARFLSRAVALLPWRLRLTMELWLYHDLTPRQIGSTLQIAETAVRKRLQAARARLRARLLAYRAADPSVSAIAVRLQRRER
jgi:RNA polymerase sigma-70 factor, ECF subfamily